ncbi:hypothetical protein KXW65_009443 [Aspergillus fumigatus]|nr:hypothetical protein KXX47_003539 [Aspergillus fumigatus]KAH1318720.1 hypothetical protein KXX38_000954 [Aspergillus fumigatus]KAH1380367.1 hypothetical protein KXX49_006418 [Aspergillus fumigatus]KAH1463322.1 hypothetical protein KXX58_007233 [Aspergillus fumigatus]KAH1671993.1 hypothetical protein KXX65_006865 [Aspergillus fumigatus]
MPDMMGFIDTLVPESLASINLWKIATIFLLAVNVKCLPFVWHYRIFKPLVRAAWRTFRSGPKLAVIPHSKTPTVFLPSITSTYAPLFECDYNMHKSNSTYFTDLDASRSYLLSALCYDGLVTVDRELAAEGKKGMLAAIIGSVTTSFKKEIRIFQEYEKGSAKPTGYLIAKSTRLDLRRSTEESRCHSGQPVIFATSISKYVFKKGRLTIPPERILRASGLMGQDNKEEKREVLPNNVQGHTSDSGVPEDIESERLKGMKYAESWNQLDSLHEELLKQDELVNGVLALNHFGDISRPWKRFTTA